MTNDSSDDRFDGWLREAARDYNRPPAQVPRDEMWQAIAAATTASAMPATPSQSTPNRFGPMRWQMWGMAVAATLVLGVGFWAGRWSNSSTDAPGPRNTVVEQAPPSVPTANGSATYQLATLRHLTDAEAMLTSFQNAPASQDARLDATVQNWARELLTNTRLLLDSPASEDAQRKQLLGDLELILVQIVQLHGGNSASDRALIDGTINRDQVMTRIRTAIPAGATSGP